MDVQDILRIDGLRKNLISLNKLRNQIYHMTLDDVLDVFTFTKENILYKEIQLRTLYML